MEEPDQRDLFAGTRWGPLPPAIIIDILTHRDWKGYRDCYGIAPSPTIITILKEAGLV